MILNPFIYQSGGGGSGPILLVTVTGATATSVTATKSGASVSLAYDSTLGKWWAVLPSTGTWTVTATNGGKTATTTVTASSVTIYEASLQIGRLPSGYTELSYVQTNGSLLFDTGVRLTSGFRLKMSALFLDATTRQRYCGAFVRSSGVSNYSDFGAAGGNKPNNPQIAVAASTTDATNVYLSANTKYALEASTLIGNSLIKVDGVTATTTTNVGNNPTARPDSNICFIGLKYYENGAVYQTAYGAATRLYNDGLRLFSSMNDADCVGDYIPARRNSDSVVGIYDIVGNSFILAEGTGSLTAGPEA